MRCPNLVLLLLLLTIVPGLSGCGSNAVAPPPAEESSAMGDTSSELIQSKPAPHDPNDI